ncbi:transposase [Streptomyces hygroscopicus]|nr:transposase [Streptomyces hygroscopicus]AQW48375.1 transposase [Streptomyces hygroscopicus]
MVTVGIDPHKHVHVAVAVGADGKRLSRPLTVKNDAVLISVLFKWIRSIADGMPVIWAIEDGRGFARGLADDLLLAGHEVVWVPTRLMAAHRKLHAATGSKSDLLDAAAVAHAALATPGLDRHRIDDRVRELRVLVDLRTDLVRRRTMVINQVKAYTHLWLDHTPGDLTRTPGMTALTTFLENLNLGPHVRRVLTEMISEAAELNQRIRDLESTIRELVTPLAPPCWRSPGSAMSRRRSCSLKSATSPGSPAQPSSPATPDALRSPSTRPTRNATACTPRRQSTTQQRALHHGDRPAEVPSWRAGTTGSPHTHEGRPRHPAHTQAPPHRRHPPRNGPRPSFLATPRHGAPAHRLT